MEEKINELRTYGVKYLNSGLSVVAIGEGKSPIGAWKHLQQNKYTVEQLEAALSNDRLHGIGIVCGAVSGGLEVIDIDLKYALRESFYEDFCTLVGDTIIRKLLIVRTISGGYHWYYKCKVIDGNEKLAWRYKTDDELKEDPKGNKICLIETRGEGGLVVCPPSPCYTFAEERKIPDLTIEEREQIWAAARSLNEVELEIKTEFTPTSTQYEKRPGDEYNNRGDVVELLEKHGWKIVGENSERITFLRPGNTTSKSSGNFNKEKNWFSVFTTNSCFETEKAYRPFHVYALLEHNGDFRAAAKSLAELGYGEPLGAANKRENKLIANDAKASDTDNELLTFWAVDKKRVITIIRHKLQEFLTDNGFYLYKYKTTSPKLIRVEKGVIELSSIDIIKKFTREYIETLPKSFDGITRQELLEQLLKGQDAYFSKSLLEFMKYLEPDFLKADKDTAYFPFNNGVIVVTRDGYELKSYDSIKKYVWKSQTIEHAIKPDENINCESIEYFRFLSKVFADDLDRISHSIEIIGYLLHNYKDSSRPWSIILAEETDSEEKGGGTGKGLFITAISKLVNAILVDGKNFRTDKSFQWQRVSIDTNIIAVDDVKKNVDFEAFYSAISTGLTIEKKNQDEIFLPYEDAPKFIFSTNYTIKSVGEHAKRRQRVLEFAAHYNSTHTPIDEFGHRLFDDWDTDEWNRFYNLMFSCVSRYLDNGISNMMSSPSIKRKHIRNDYGQEFLDWWEDFTAKVFTQENGPLDGCELSRTHEEFLINCGLEKKEYSLKRWKNGLLAACSIFEFDYLESKDRNRSGKRFFTIKKRTGSKNGSGPDAVHSGPDVVRKEEDEQDFF